MLRTCGVFLTEDSEYRFGIAFADTLRRMDMTAVKCLMMMAMMMVMLLLLLLLMLMLLVLCPISVLPPLLLWVEGTLFFNGVFVLHGRGLFEL